MSDVYALIEKLGPLYIGYRDRAEPQDAKEVNDRLRGARAQLKTIQSMIASIHEGTIEEVADIYKAGPSYH